MNMHALKKYIQIGVIAGLLSVGTACSSIESPSSTTTISLYDRLGQKSAITAVVDEFVGNVAKDDRINSRFATTDIPRLKGHLVDQVCMATGGPCQYTGRDMVATHKGMRISNADFNAIVEDLIAALNTVKVPDAEQKELLRLLSPMKSDIVEIP